MGKIIASDLDGTLLKPKKQFHMISKENRKFLQEFYGDVVIVTGRGAKFCAKVCNYLKIDHNFVALNGAMIVRNGKVIFKQSLKKTVLHNMFDFLQEYYTILGFLIFDKYDDITGFLNDKSFLKREPRYEKITINNKFFLKILTDEMEDIYKAIIFVKNTNEILELLKEKYSDHFEFFTNNHSIEVSPIGINKGKSLKYLISTTNVKNEDVFVVGDGSNDIPMFEEYENSFVINKNDGEIKIKAKYNLNRFIDLKEYTKQNENFR